MSFGLGTSESLRPCPPPTEISFPEAPGCPSGLQPPRPPSSHKTHTHAQHEKHSLKKADTPRSASGHWASPNLQTVLSSNYIRLETRVDAEHPFVLIPQWEEKVNRRTIWQKHSTFVKTTDPMITHKIKSSSTDQQLYMSREQNSPEPEDGIMFPDLWTSSNLLKITFNLWEQTDQYISKGRKKSRQ